MVLAAADLVDCIEPSGLPGDLTSTLTAAGRAKASQLLNEGRQLKADLDIDPDLALDSDEEMEFLAGWLPEISIWAARWAAPQAPFRAFVGIDSGSD